jgi:hypothetical protein
MRCFPLAAATLPHEARGHAPLPGATFEKQASTEPPAWKFYWESIWDQYAFPRAEYLVVAEGNHEINS